MLECQSGRGDVEAEFTALLTSGFEEDGRCRQVLVERSQNHGLQASSNQPACAACDDDMSDSADSEARVRLSRRRSRGGLARLGRPRRRRHLRSTRDTREHPANVVSTTLSPGGNEGRRYPHA